MVHDFAGESRNPDASVEARGGQPQRATAAVGNAVPPETDVVSAAGTPAGELFECEVLGPSPREEVSAHRGRVIRALEEDAPRVAQPALQSNAVGQGPPRGAHRGEKLAGSADDGDVDRIGGNSLCGVAQPREGDLRRKLDVPPPHGRNQDVRERRVRRQKEPDERGRAQPAGEPPGSAVACWPYAPGLHSSEG